MLSDLKKQLAGTDPHEVAQALEAGKNTPYVQDVIRLYESVWYMTYGCSAEPEFVQMSEGPLAGRMALMNVQEDLMPAVPCAIREVERLDVGGFPEACRWEELAQYINLIRLDFWENNLNALPAAVFGLSRLQTLYVYDELEFLSPEIGKLTGLKELLLSGNRLQRLPEELGKLTRLEILDVSDNKLTELPEALMNLTTLKMLDTGGNPDLHLTDVWRHWADRNGVELPE